MNGVRVRRKGPAVKDPDGNAVESYAYDKAGNMLKKQILRSGRARSPVSPERSEPRKRSLEVCAPQSEDYITTTFTFDDANQLVSSTTDGVTTHYAYDAAGRLVREGSKTYRYGYLDKVMSVQIDQSDSNSQLTTHNSQLLYTFSYHADGQLASASYVDNGRAGAPRTPQSETFLWDGLALIQRGDEQFINEPHVGGGNPVASSKGTSYFNDMLGTTVGSKSNGKYSAHYVELMKYVKKRRWELIDGLENFLYGTGFGFETSAGYAALTGVGTIPAEGLALGGIACHTLAEIVNTLNSWLWEPVGDPIKMPPEKRKVDSFELHVLE